MYKRQILARSPESSLRDAKTVSPRDTPRLPQVIWVKLFFRVTVPKLELSALGVDSI